MASPTPHNNFGFVTICTGVHLYRPAEPVQVDPSHPTLILIFGWMGAKVPHLQKYGRTYRERYPGGSIMLIASEASLFFSSENTRRKNISPVLKTLEAMGWIPSAQHASTTTANRVLIHAFSNGGALQFTTLSDALALRHSSLTTTQHSTSAIVFDSCPGQVTLSTSQRAFTVGIRQPLLTFVNIFLAMAYFLLAFGYFVTRKRDIITVMRTRLNDLNIFPWVHKGTPRLYIYSSGDKLVPGSVVEQHIREARGVGLNVQAERFGNGSAHVSHARTDPERYWAAVDRVWKDALDSEGRRDS